MTGDLEILRDGEFMIAHVEGTTEAGAEFVDAYLGEEIVVVDSGRIIVQEDDLDRLLENAAAAGLKVEP